MRQRTRSTLFPYTTLFRSAMDGNTATYMQYAYARISNIFRKGGDDAGLMRTHPPQPHLDTPHERALAIRSEEHTSELQSHSDLVCRLLLEKKNTHIGGDA